MRKFPLFAMHILMAMKISLHVFHIPGADNFIADALLHHLINYSCSINAAWTASPSFSTPSQHAGAATVMLPHLSKPRQPAHAAWSCDCLLCEHVVTLSHAFDNSTVQTYNWSLAPSVLLDFFQIAWIFTGSNS